MQPTATSPPDCRQRPDSDEDAAATAVDEFEAVAAGQEVSAEQQGARKDLPGTPSTKGAAAEETAAGEPAQAIPEAAADESAQAAALEAAGAEDAPITEAVPARSAAPDSPELRTGTVQLGGRACMLTVSADGIHWALLERGRGCGCGWSTDLAALPAPTGMVASSRSALSWQIVAGAAS